MVAMVGKQPSVYCVKRISDFPTDKQLNQKGGDYNGKAVAIGEERFAT